MLFLKGKVLFQKTKKKFLTLIVKATSCWNAYEKNVIAVTKVSWIISWEPRVWKLPTKSFLLLLSALHTVKHIILKACILGLNFSSNLAKSNFSSFTLVSHLVVTLLSVVEYIIRCWHSLMFLQSWVGPSLHKSSIIQCFVFLYQSVRYYLHNHS